MKLIVTIPAYNEEKKIAEVIKSIPRKIKGITSVSVLVVDDGSTDKTLESARKAGADFFARNKKNAGLAFTFQKAMDLALKLGADIVVNTDADNQYDQAQIPSLVAPIIAGEADIVNGNRQVENLDHMVPAKKYGNIFGTKLVAAMAGYPIKDASSGFRAYSKEALLRLFVTSEHTYTHQTLIKAGFNKLKVVEVDVSFRKRAGKSKLIKSVSSHIRKSMKTIVQTKLMYDGLKTFSVLGIFMIIIGLIPAIRWAILTYVTNSAGSHIQSLVIGVMIMLFGGLSIVVGFLADLIATNRKLTEEILYYERKRASKEK